MLDTIVRYLHESLVPFKLASYPSMEHLPKAVYPLPKNSVLVDTQVFVVAGQLVIACWPSNGTLDIPALSTALAAPVIAALPDDLPESLKHREGPPPPLGQLLGMSVVVDEALERYAIIVFQPFGESDYFEVPYDDYARQEAPKVASFSRAGELPPEERAAAAATSAPR